MHDVRPIDIGQLMAKRRQINHTAMFAGEQHVEQKCSKEEMPQMINSELGLEPVLGLRLCARHHTRVVKQNVQRKLAGFESFSERGNRLQIAQVDRKRF